jgi:hypothetical protein
MGGPLCTRVFLLALSCYGAAPLAMGARSVPDAHRPRLAAECFQSVLWVLV